MSRCQCLHRLDSHHRLLHEASFCRTSPLKLPSPVSLLKESIRLSLPRHPLDVIRPIAFSIPGLCKRLQRALSPEGAAVVNARSGHGIHHIVFTNVCCLVLVFGGYLGGAGIARCCVSRMRVGCSQKGTIPFYLEENYNIAERLVPSVCRSRNGCARMLGKYTPIVWDQVGIYRLLAS
jgi:hypothetical protein